MRRVYWEIFSSIAFVLGGAAFFYILLESDAAFWDAQHVWSWLLVIGYTIISFEYVRYGWQMHHGKAQVSISPLLTASIIFVYCVIFIKGVYFNDWSLMVSALIVNSGVVFLLYQIMNRDERLHHHHKRR